MFTQMFLSMGREGAGVFSNFQILFGIHIITMLMTFILITIYLVNVYRNVSVDKDKKILWTILILFGSIVAMPIYWFLFIWKDPRVEV